MKHKQNTYNMYCNSFCHKEHKYKQQVLRWLEGFEVGWTGKCRQLKNFVRRYITELRGTACEICGWDDKHPIDGATLTEIDHIDGDAENCHQSNLMVICPNCHSKTPTFRARNKVSKRER